MVQFSSVIEQGREAPPNNACTPSLLRSAPLPPYGGLRRDASRGRTARIPHRYASGTMSRVVRRASDNVVDWKASVSLEVMHINLNIVILSLFCAGGLFAYVREGLRLHRLMSAGKVALARIVKKMEDSGSESIVHYLVTYEFVDEQGNTLIHEQDLNSKKFFRSLAIGDTIEVLYNADRTGNSYPLSQVQSDWRMSCYIAAVILLFWVGMAVYFVLLK